MEDTYICICLLTPNFKKVRGISHSGRTDNKNYSYNYIFNRSKLISVAGSLENFLIKTSDAMEKMRRIEGRVATDQDLKLSDALRYHMHDSTAAKDLLFRRLRCACQSNKFSKATYRGGPTFTY